MVRMSRIKRPTATEERALQAQGFALIAGTDEAGCGCWAGPVFAAAVILPPRMRTGLIRDSKTLSISQRESVALHIREKAVAWAVGSASVQEVDALNIRRAGALAMLRAIRALTPQPTYVLSDAFRIPGLLVPCKNIINGDALITSIAAASILAKVARDACMSQLDVQFPVYGFANHKGYGTAQHKRALQKHGPCELHRMSYAPLKAWI